MPRRDTPLRLQDIAEAIDRILRYTAPHTFESFRGDEMAVDAVVRNFEVIGEAARHVDSETAARCPDVPWQDIRDMRNLLMHEYFGVSVAIVWETITRDLPGVRDAIRIEIARQSASEADDPPGSV